MSKKIFLDTNIVIDFLTSRNLQQTQIIDLLHQTAESDIYISALTVHIVFYILKIKQDTDLFNNVSSFFEKINIIPLTGLTTKKAMKVSFSDFEDILQYLSAEEICDFLLTRNTKDFLKIKKLVPSNIRIISNFSDINTK